MHHLQEPFIGVENVALVEKGAKFGSQEWLLQMLWEKNYQCSSLANLQNLDV